MATDQTGRTVAVDEVYLLAGRVRRIESNDVLVVLGNGNVSAQRAKAADLVRVDDVVVTNGSRPFTAPQSQTALPTDAAHLTPKLYVDAADSALIAVAVSIFQPLSAILSAIAGATGTPSSSTFLRGDWTWATPEGGGGGGGVELAVVRRYAYLRL
jgi:hypothetical protein